MHTVYWMARSQVDSWNKWEGFPKGISGIDIHNKSCLISEHSYNDRVSKGIICLGGLSLFPLVNISYDNKLEYLVETVVLTS